MMKKLALVLAAAGMVAFAGSASAQKPGIPGCFGQDRAAFLHGAFIGNKDGTLAQGGNVPATDDGEPGASRWGEIAGDRGATNGDQNRAYKEGSRCHSPD